MFNRLFRFLLVFCLITSVAVAREIKFVQLSDTHYSPIKEISLKDFKMKHKSGELVTDAIEQINKEKGVDFVIITGDGADKPVKEHFETIYGMYNTMNPDWYYVLGNHDTNSEFKKSDQIKLLKKMNKKMKKFDKTFYSFSPKHGFTFVALDPTYDFKVSSQGYIPPEQLKFLKNILDKKKKDVIVIYMHYPLSKPLHFNNNHDIVNEYAINDLLKEYKQPILTLGGHLHGTKIECEGNIIKVASPALVSYPHAFRIITIDNKRKETTFKFEYRETNLKELSNFSKVRIFWGAKGAYGKTPKDRENTITVTKK